ncbi:MAG: hypothetical protein COB02_08610 [Candidatus Cloacimonadota bacterium]|nr:MAG: hypothetical protein COB02_08610 [Candidatus Cloacimonadota bacterium]
MIQNKNKFPYEAKGLKLNNFAYTILEIMFVVSIITVLLATFFLISMRRAGSMRDKIKSANALRLQEKVKLDKEIEMDDELHKFRDAMEAQKAQKRMKEDSVTPAIFRISKGINYSGNTDSKSSLLAKKLLSAATLKIKLNQMKEALQLLKEASNLGAFEPKTSLEVAKLFWQAGDFKYAQESLDNALMLDPEYADAHLLKARLFIKNNRLDLAEKSIIATENLSHKNADVLLVWSEFYLKKGNKARSRLLLEEYKMIISRNPN